MEAIVIYKQQAFRATFGVVTFGDYVSTSHGLLRVEMVVQYQSGCIVQLVDCSEQTVEEFESMLTAVGPNAGWHAVALRPIG